MSGIVKRSVMIAGHSTSVSLEAEFWEALKQMAASSSLSLAALIADIDRQRGNPNLSSALRLAVLSHYKAQAPGREPD